MVSARDMSKLQQNIKERIKKALEKYSEDPFPYARKMADSTLGTYRFEVKYTDVNIRKFSGFIDWRTNE